MRRMLLAFGLTIGVQGSVLPELGVSHLIKTILSLTPSSLNIVPPTTMPRGGPVGPPATVPEGLVESSTNMTFTQGHSPFSFAASTDEPHELATPSDIYPATLLLCQETDCGACVGFDLSTAPQNACLQSADPNFEFVSVGIVQPSDIGLPYAVLVGPGGCTDFAAIPNVETCLEITTPPFTQFALITEQ